MSFTLLGALNKRTVRAPVNPMDKSTIVSIFPREIKEVKHTIEPGHFSIPAGTVEKPGLLVVGPSSWWKELEENQPLLEIPTSSIVVADSIVKDWCNGVLACNMGDTIPGLFYLPGEHTIFTILKDHKSRLDLAIERQNRWYLALCQMADALWATSGGNPRTISEVMRIAAQALGFEDKPWIKDFQMAAMHRCEACGNLRDPRYPVCPHCKAIDPKHPMAKELKFAV